MTVLIVEDESRTAQELRKGLEAAGLETLLARSAEEALRLSAPAFEAMVVDVMLPGLSGLELVRRLREQGDHTPVLFLSAKGSLEDRLRGLETGGDDYLPKPYSILEVVARVRTITRRNVQEAPERVQVADLAWEPQSRTITRSGQIIELTPKEYALMTLLLKNLGKVVPRSLIIQTVWGLEEGVDANAVDVQILRLRKKVDGPYATKLIHTLRGVGLRLDPRVAP